MAYSLGCRSLRPSGCSDAGTSWDNRCAFHGRCSATSSLTADARVEALPFACEHLWMQSFESERKDDKPE